MVIEQALFKVKPGSEAEFEAAVKQGSELISRSPGFISLELHQGIEDPSSFLLLNCWQTLADHTEGFRGSDLFPQWRALIGPFFAADPVVNHYTAPTVHK